MAKVFRKITKKFVVIANIILAIFFIFSCLAYYLNPVTYWYFAFLGLAFPYFLLFVLIFLGVWVCFKSKWIILNLFLLGIAYNNIKAVFAFHPFAKKFTLEKQPNAVRIMQWNTMSFGEDLLNRVDGSETRELMLNYIKENDPDILCFQEFYDSDLPRYNNNVKLFTNNLGYPNYINTKDYVRYIKHDSLQGYTAIGDLGIAIFTKLPMIDSGRIPFSNGDLKNKESICFIDVIKNTDTIRIFSTHLKSIGLAKKDYNEVYKIKDATEEGINASKSVIAKITNAYEYRKSQAELLKSKIVASPYPVLVTGDFNDVPNSYSYATIKGNMQDAFLKKGFGIGRTFNAISPTLRIDFIFADEKFKVIQAKKENKKLSDHYPIIADVELVK
jgi:endonuclease/exonuclease/phosphatase family metal-dependent hydrolase